MEERKQVKIESTTNAPDPARNWKQNKWPQTMKWPLAVTLENRKGHRNWFHFGFRVDLKFGMERTEIKTSTRKSSSISSDIFCTDLGRQKVKNIQIHQYSASSEHARNVGNIFTFFANFESVVSINSFYPCQITKVYPIDLTCHWLIRLYGEEVAFCSPLLCYWYNQVLLYDIFITDLL